MNPWISVKDDVLILSRSDWVYHNGSRDDARLAVMGHNTGDIVTHFALGAWRDRQDAARMLAASPLAEIVGAIERICDEVAADYDHYDAVTAWETKHRLLRQLIENYPGTTPEKTKGPEGPLKSTT